MEEETITKELNVPHQVTLPMKKIRINEVKNVIQRKIHPTKAPGYDLIAGKVLQELSQKGLTQSDNTNITPYCESNTFPVSGK